MFGGRHQEYLGRAVRACGAASAGGRRLVHTREHRQIYAARAAQLAKPVEHTSAAGAAKPSRAQRSTAKSSEAGVAQPSTAKRSDA
jgi:hypothetical protein